MRTFNSAKMQSSRMRPLAACLALALTGEINAASHVDNYGTAQANLAAYNPGAQLPSATQPYTSQVRVVQNCSDHDTNSLRDIIENPNSPNYAHSGDTVDLSQIPILCLSAISEITLSTGQILISQDSLTLKGPANEAETVVISGGGASRVFDHEGVGTLALYDLTITGGYYNGSTEARGGCIFASTGTGAVFLNRASVTHCVARSELGSAFGGGIHAKDVMLALSTVSDNEAVSPAVTSYGGGIYSDALLSVYSAISANAAQFGGGAYVIHGVVIQSSTIDDNTANYGGGIAAKNSPSVKIAESTISTNTAHRLAPALFLKHSASALISNTTIAFNNADISQAQAGAVSFTGQQASDILTLQSSIVAMNAAGGTPADIYVSQGVLYGADNLVMSSNSSPPGVITVTADPKLGPLQQNGGPTRTHVPAWDSPVLKKGNNNVTPSIETDQRGSGYPRVTLVGGVATVDIGAVEFDTIFSGHLDFN